LIDSFWRCGRPVQNARLPIHIVFYAHVRKNKLRFAIVIFIIAHSVFSLQALTARSSVFPRRLSISAKKKASQ